MIRRSIPFLLLGLAAGCSGGGGSGDRLDQDILVKNLSGPTTEAGDTATFQIVLRSQPSSEVVLSLTSDDLSEGEISHPSLTFTQFNWNAPQTVTVYGQDDVEDDGNVVFHVTVDPPQTNDQKYAAIVVPPIPITNIDDETASVLVGPPSGATTEEGGEATISIRLSSQPVADVTIPVSSDDPSEATVSPAALVFSPLNWTTAQTITVTGVDDDLVDGNLEFTVTVSAAASTDPAYDGLAPLVEQLTLLNVDDETAGVTTTSTDAVTSEGAGTGVFGVRLNAEPSADVVLTFDVDDATEAMLDLTTLTFTSADWDQEQTVTVTGLDDDIADGPQPYLVVFMAAQSNDPAYDGMAIESREFVNLDDEQGGITVAPLVGVTTETAGQHSFTVVLDGQPSDDVTFSVASSDPSEGTVTPSSLTFTTMDWDQPQTVTVTGEFDRKADGNKRYWITFGPAVTSDPIYDGVRAQRVNMTNVDDGPSPEALVFDDGIASHAPFAATTAGEFSVTMAGDAAAFEAGLATASLVIVELSSTILPPSTETALAAWITSGGSAIISYHDLDGAPALQAALGVSASAPHTGVRYIFRNPGSEPDLFRYSRTLATVITGTDTVADNGHELTLTGSGSLPVRFDTSSGAGAVAVTNDGRVIVNGFAPDDMDASDVDGDGREDILELYENQIRYLGRGAAPIRMDNDVPFDVVDLESRTSTLVVSGIPEGLTAVHLSIHAKHTWVSDMDITLIAPDGTAIDVSSDLGSSGDDLGASCDDADRVTFDDGGTATLPTSSSDAPWAGTTWKPEQPFANLLGIDGNGTWTLSVFDDGTGDIGTVECWSLFLEY